MKQHMLVSLLLALGCVLIRAAPVEQDGVEQGSCEDASALGAARLALNKINGDRQEGYIFSLHRLSNVHMTKHEAANGIVFYLTLDVVETNCSVLSKKDYKDCEPRPTSDTPVYGQCNAAIYISKVNRVVRLYKYSCLVRPVPTRRVHEMCPDCPTPTNFDNDQIQKLVSLSLEKFNNEGGLSKRFALLKISRATSGYAMSMYYNAEYTIQETICNKSAEATNCPLMTCEFAHKGFCKASLWHSPTGDPETTVECEIYEPEAAEREKKAHLLGGETDHSHTDTHQHSDTHDHVHTADAAHTHDHAHDHTHGHSHSDHTHGDDHDHAHTHHAKAHDHSADSPNHHHDYKHAADVHTHEHDHEHALDHDHKHAHLHNHEHHHHHHEHETPAHDHPEGSVRVLPSMDQPMTLPAFPEEPVGTSDIGVTLPLKPDPQIPGQMEPIILPFPSTVSAQCAPAPAGETLVEKVFAEDPRFHPSS